MQNVPSYSNTSLFRAMKLVAPSIFALVLFGSSVSIASAATVRLAPSGDSIEVGDSVSVRVSLSSTDQAVNAVSGVINFPNTLLELTSLSKSASVIGLWVQEPSFSNSQGTVRFEGVVLNPGYTGSGGTVITARFRALKEGSATLLLSEVQALANDGNGTDILSGSSGTTITISPATRKPAPQGTTQPAPIEETPQLEVVPPEPPITPSPRVSRSVWDILQAWAITIGIGFGITLLILCIILLLILLYLRYRALKQHMRQELRTVDATMHKALVLLRDEIEGFVTAVEKEKSKRKLTLLENKFAKRMKQNLADTEKVMKKVIHDAEDKL